MLRIIMTEEEQIPAPAPINQKKLWLTAGIGLVVVLVMTGSAMAYVGTHKKIEIIATPMVTASPSPRPTASVIAIAPTSTPTPIVTPVATPTAILKLATPIPKPVAKPTSTPTPAIPPQCPDFNYTLSIYPGMSVHIKPTRVYQIGSSVDSAVWSGGGTFSNFNSGTYETDWTSSTPGSYYLTLTLQQRGLQCQSTLPSKVTPFPTSVPGLSSINAGLLPSGSNIKFYFNYLNGSGHPIITGQDEYYQQFLMMPITANIKIYPVVMDVQEQTPRVDKNFSNDNIGCAGMDYLSCSSRFALVATSDLNLIDSDYQSNDQKFYFKAVITVTTPTQGSFTTSVDGTVDRSGIVNIINGRG